MRIAIVHEDVIEIEYDKFGINLIDFVYYEGHLMAPDEVIYVKVTR